jgi:hypothetical protein
VGGRCQPGGILKVLEIIGDHERALVYDFRDRFGLGLADIGTTVPWREVVHLVAILARDPSSWLQTSMRDWAHPISYDWAVLASIYDLLASVHSKTKPKPFQRPWSNRPDGANRPVPRADAKEILLRARNGEIKWQNKPMPM